MATLYDGFDYVVQAIADAINTYSPLELNLNGNPELDIPAQAYKGWPVAEELTTILAQHEYAVSVYDKNNVKNMARYFKRSWTQQAPQDTLVATVDFNSNSITFSGIAPSGSNLTVHTFVGPPMQDAFFQTAPGDSPAIAAAKTAAAINALGLSFGTAWASGATVYTSGIPTIDCMISGTAIVRTEVGRDEREFQVTVWAPDPFTRMIATQAIIENVGTTDRQWVQLEDGTTMRLRKHGDIPVDKSQSDYSLYEHHLFFLVELPTTRQSTKTQVASFRVTQNLNSQTKSVIVGD